MSSVNQSLVSNIPISSAGVMRRAVSGVVRPVRNTLTPLAALLRANRLLLRDLWRAFPVITALRLFAGVTMIACPFATWWGSGVVIQGLTNKQPLSSMSGALLAMFASLVMMSVLPTLLASLDKICENWVFRHVQSTIAAKAVKLDKMTFTEPGFASRFKQVKDRAVWRMMSMMRSQPLLIRSLGVVVITLGILGWYDYRLAAFVVLAFVPCAVVEARHARTQSKVDEELAPLWGSLWGDLWNLTTSVSIAMLQVFGASSWFADRYRQGIDRAASRENRLERRAIAVRIAVATFGGVAAVGVSLVLMSRVASGSLELGLMVLLLGAVSSLGLSLAEVATLIGQQFNQSYYVNALDDLLRTDARIRFPERGISMDAENSSGISLAFRGVCYRYPGAGQSTYALQGVDFTLSGGRKVAMVGPNGAGKSTAMSLMTRQVDPTDGEVQLGDTPLSQLDLATLRQQVILLPQSLRHYNLTVRELLNLGRPNRPATDEELYRALKRTGADGFLERWTNRLETQLGDDRPHAVEPSGGQLQRLLLAAVLLSSSRLIILDEPVSMVDPEAARQFWDAVFTAMPEKTVVFSTHHLGAVRRADLILYIDEGRLVASGHHDELIESCPRYRSLFESQASDYR